MPLPNPPNPNTTDDVTPKGCFYNKLCGIKKGQKEMTVLFGAIVEYRPLTLNMNIYQFR